MEEPRYKVAVGGARVRQFRDKVRIDFGLRLLPTPVDTDYWSYLVDGMNRGLDEPLDLHVDRDGGIDVALTVEELDWTFAVTGALKSLLDPDDGIVPLLRELEDHEARLRELEAAVLARVKKAVEKVPNNRRTEFGR